jgi:hypothetical protein
VLHRRLSREEADDGRSRLGGGGRTDCLGSLD